jgi:DNA-directed RNA polymerase delta subunit
MRKNSLNNRQVLDAYKVQSKPRSIRRLRDELVHKYSEMMKNQSISIPTLATMWNWSSKFGWDKIIEIHDARVNEKLNERLVNKSVNKLESIVKDLQDVSYLALKKVVNALNKDLIKPIEDTASLKQLVDSVNTAIKSHALLVGGVTSRSESISHNVSNNKKQIREEIIQLITSLNEDGIQIQMDEDKSKLN